MYLPVMQTPRARALKSSWRLQYNFIRLYLAKRDALKTALDEEAIRTKLEGLIDQRLNQMTPQTVKEIIQDMIRKHLGWLVVWGCAFGGLIGLIVTVVANYQA